MVATRSTIPPRDNSSSSNGISINNGFTPQSMIHIVKAAISSCKSLTHVFSFTWSFFSQYIFTTSGIWSRSKTLSINSRVKQVCISVPYNALSFITLSDSSFPRLFLHCFIPSLSGMVFLITDVTPS